MTKTLTDIKREAREDLEAMFEAGSFHNAFEGTIEVANVGAFLDTFADRLLEEVERAAIVEIEGLGRDTEDEDDLKQCVLEAFAKFKKDHE